MVGSDNCSVRFFVVLTLFWCFCFCFFLCHCKFLRFFVHFHCELFVRYSLAVFLCLASFIFSLLGKCVCVFCFLILDILWFFLFFAALFAFIFHKADFFLFFRTFYTHIVLLIFFLFVKWKNALNVHLFRIHLEIVTNAIVVAFVQLSTFQAVLSCTKTTISNSFDT